MNTLIFHCSGLGRDDGNNAGRAPQAAERQTAPTSFVLHGPPWPNESGVVPGIRILPVQVDNGPQQPPELVAPAGSVRRPSIAGWLWRPPGGALILGTFSPVAAAAFPGAQPSPELQPPAPGRIAPVPGPVLRAVRFPG